MCPSRRQAGLLRQAKVGWIIGGQAVCSMYQALGGCEGSDQVTERQIKLGDIARAGGVGGERSKVKGVTQKRDRSRLRRQKDLHPPQRRLAKGHLTGSRTTQGGAPRQAQLRCHPAQTTAPIFSLFFPFLTISHSLPTPPSSNPRRRVYCEDPHTSLPMIDGLC